MTPDRPIHDRRTLHLPLEKSPCSSAIDKVTVLTHYIVVRRDLPLGFLAAQVTHAAGESSPCPAPPETNAVVLAVPNEGALLLLHRGLTSASIPHSLIREPDSPYCGAATAIGFPPCPRSSLSPYLGGLPLLK